MASGYVLLRRFSRIVRKRELSRYAILRIDASAQLLDEELLWEDAAKKEHSEVPLSEFVPGQLWLQEYPIHYAGCDFNARMTVIRVSDTKLLLHSPCEIDSAIREEISALGEVAYIVAPGSYHYFYVPSAQAAFPDADTYICPGVERKRPDLDFDWFLADRPPEAWAGVLDQVLVRGNKLIWEVAFLHRPSRTLLLVDLIENFTDQTPGVNWVLKLWWKAVFHMWDKPKPAPEYQIGWKDKEAARESLLRILEWDFDKIVMAHGDLIETDAKERARDAWRKPLRKTAAHTGVTPGLGGD